MRHPGILGNFLGRFRTFFVYAAFFSLAINLLLLVPPLYMLQVFDRAISSRSGETLAMLTVAAIAALTLMALLDMVRARLLSAAAIVLDRSLGPGVLRELLSRLRPAELGTGLRDVAALRSFLMGAGVLALFDAPWLPLFILIIFLFHPLLGAIAVAGALGMWLLAFLNERCARAPVERVQAEGRRAARFIDAGARNAEVVNALGMLPALARRWAHLNDGVLREQLRSGALAARFAGWTKFLRQAIQVAMLGAAAYLVILQEVSAGVMIASTILLGRALAPVETVVAAWRSLIEARGAWRRLREVLGEKEASTGGMDLPAPTGRVEVERATFALPGQGRPIVRAVSFALQPGEMLGIIGPSASGKSSLARLLLGVWKPVTGTVRLDGADVAGWPREKLGPHLGYLPQDVELFAGSVAENIARLSEPDATEVVRAARRAHVHELILRLPEGYDTELSEGGQPLSPGQRQRIALARALYGNPRFVVLDEPNSNLDAEGEQALLRTLAALREEGVTVVLITHRPSLLGPVDKILVLREGVAEAVGPRSEILRRLTAATAREAA